MQVSGRIAAVQEQRFKLLTDAGQAYLLLSLVLHRGDAPRAVLQRLDRLALAANMLELVLSLRLHREWKSRGVSATRSRSRRRS